MWASLLGEALLDCALHGQHKHAGGGHQLDGAPQPHRQVHQKQGDHYHFHADIYDMFSALISDKYWYIAINVSSACDKLYEPITEWQIIYVVLFTS